MTRGTQVTTASIVNMMDAELHIMASSGPHFLDAKTVTDEKVQILDSAAFLCGPYAKAWGVELFFGMAWNARFFHALELR